MIFLLLLVWTLIFKQQANLKMFCNLLEFIVSKLQETSVGAKKLQQPIATTFKFVVSYNSFNFKQWEYSKDLAPHCI
jgi:hypothetical protein